MGERLIPGGGFLVETGEAQRLIPGGGFVNETLTAQAAGEYVHQLGFKTTRTTQPQGFAEIDWSNPITRGMRAIFAPSMNRIGMAALPSTFGPTENGLAYNKTEDRATTVDVGYAAVPGAVSMLALTKFRNFSGGTFGSMPGAVIYSQRSTVTAKSPTLAVSNGQFTGGAGTNRVWFGTDSDATAVGAYHPTVIEINKPYLFIATADAASSSTSRVTELTVNGVSGAVNHTPTGSWNSSWSGSPGVLGSNASWGTVDATQDIALFAIWSRELSKAEVKSLNVNPYQIFKPQETSIWIPHSVAAVVPPPPVAQLTFKTTRTSQPQGMVGIDASHPLSSLIKAVVLPNTKPVSAGSGVSLAATDAGKGYKFNGVYNQGFIASPGVMTTQNFTLIANLVVVGTTDKVIATSQNSTYSGIAVTCTATTLKAGIRGANFGTGVTFPTINDGKSHTIGVSRTSGGNTIFSLDGRILGTQASGVDGVIEGGGRIGEMNGWGYTTADTMNLVASLSGAVSADTLVDLTRNCWQLLNPIYKTIWTPHGTANITLPTLVQPASTTSAGAWTATGAATLHDAINEVAPSAAEYISVESLSTCTLVLAEAAFPGGANQVLAMRASSTSGSLMRVLLKQGGTGIMSRTQALTSIDTLYTWTLSEAEVAAITAGPITVDIEILS